MAQGFNLTAQLNLRGPANVKQIGAQIKKDLGNLNVDIKFKIDLSAAKNVAALSGSLKQLNATFSSTVTSAQQAAAAIKAFGGSVASVNIKAVPQQLASTSSAINKIKNSATSSAKGLAQASTEMQEFGKQAGLAVRRFAAFSAVTSVIYGVTNSINQGIQAFIDYDRELVKLQQVTGESSQGLAKLQNQISTLAVQFGVSSKELTTVALTLAQAGLSARDTERSLKALALSSLAPSFDSMNETVEGSIALMRQFGISASELEAALGSVNTVAAQFAVEASDIITAIQRTGSVFATASKGVSEGKDALNEFIAVFTSVRATTRESAETIATGLRTIFTRIQRGSTIDALKEFGVNLTDAEGKFVGAYKAVELLSKGLSGIDPRSLDFSRIVEELGGFRQIGKVIPLIQQFGVAQEALKVAQRGQGSLARDAATAQLSLANKIVKVREEFFALFREIGASKGFQTIARGALDLTSGLIKLTSALKGILPALTVMLAFKGARALTEFASGFVGGVRRGPDNKIAGQKANNGGVIRRFARGGVVPGSGDGDTVPAMLMPGEFVIRKKAVQAIGADKLHDINKYGGGGSIRRGKSRSRVRFAQGGAAEIASIDGNLKAIDGDTFEATVTPKGKQFTASFRVADFDAYETGKRTSRVSLNKAVQLREIKKNKGKKPPKDGPSGFTISPDYYVTNDLTAKKAALLAKEKLQEQIQNFKDINQIKIGGGFGRYLAKGFSMDSNLTTGRKWDKKGKLEEFAKGGKVQKFKAGGKATSSSGLLMSALESFINQEHSSSTYSAGDVLKVQGLSGILSKIEKSYGVSSAKVVGAGGENVAFDIGQEILKISRTGFGAQTLAKDFGVKKQDRDKMGNYQLPSGVPGVTGYRGVKKFGKITAALQDKANIKDTKKSWKDAELLQGKLAKQGMYWLDAGGPNMGYDKEGNPTVIDGLVFPKSFVNKNIGKNHREDIEVEGIMAEIKYDESLKKSKGKKKFMAGGKAEEPFGTGQIKFPKRITNAYAKELQKKIDKEKVDNVFDPYPKNERININPEEVAQQFQSKPFDRQRFLHLFNTKISRNELVDNLSDFAKFIGLPGEDLAKVLPQTIDFGGELQRPGYRGKFTRDPFGTQGYDNKGLESFGFTQADEQDLFGYEKLLDEKTKEIKKIMKTPTKTFDDGSFSIDNDAFNKAMDEKGELGKKVSDIMDKRAIARKALMEHKKGVLESTGRGFISMSSDSFAPNQERNVLYHELTHQLLNSLRHKSEDSFTKYKERVSQLFSRDNDGLVDAFDALGGSYNSADVVYGRSYKNGLLDNVLQELRRGTISSGGRSSNPELAKEGYSMWLESGQKKNAREYRPINPKINEILLKGGQKQETIDKVEDYGKEEFLTTLIQKAPKLDSNMQGILDSTLNELLGSTGIQRQNYAKGGKVIRKIGVIDTDVLRDPANAKIVKAAMEELGISDVSDYSTKLSELAAQARKKEELDKFIAIAGAAGSGKSSLAMGRGANDIAELRETSRIPILSPSDIAGVNQVISLTSTASQQKLDAYLKDVDRAYVLSSNSKAEQELVQQNRDARDMTGVGLYGRKPGTTRGATKDFGLEETILREELGDKAVVLGRKSGYQLRRKKSEELPEIVQAGGFYTGGFAPPTVGHAGALQSLLERMIEKDPNSSLEDILVSIAPNLAMVEGKEGLAHSARYGIFPADFRALMSRINFGQAMLSQDVTPPGGYPKYMEVMGSGDRRKFARLKGALAVTSGKDEGVLGKYERAGIQVKDIPRIDDISATDVRTALFNGDDATLAKTLHPDIASVLMGNRAQLRNRSTMVPMLLEEVQKVVEIEKERANQQVEQLLASLPPGPNGRPYRNVSQALKENYPDVAKQIQDIRSARDKLTQNASGYRAHSVISLLSNRYPDIYGLDPNRRSKVSVSPSDIQSEEMLGQIKSAMGDVFTTSPTGETVAPSGLQEAILKKVAKETSVAKTSGILPAKGGEILKRFRDERFPRDVAFGEFAGKTVGDSAVGGKLKYWNSSFPPATNPEKLAYYIAARDYLISKFEQSQGTQKAAALEKTVNAVMSSKQLGLVGLNPLGYTGLLGPETWDLGQDGNGQDISLNASIVQRGLPSQYQNVIDYLSGQTEEIVGGASKLLGISPKKLTKKQRETLGQGNIEGALLEQIFGSADATILDDALRTRPIDFPMGIGAKAAKIFGIDPDIPTEVKRTIDSNSRSKAVEEFQRYFRQQYGIPEPEKAQKFAGGGRVKLYHGSNTGIDDNVLKSFKEKGALSNIATGYGQGAGFYLYTEKSKAEQQAKMRVNGGSNFTLASGDRSGKPMVLSFEETVDPKTFDLDYELQKGLIVQWLHSNYETLKDKYAPSEDQTGLKGKLDKNPNAGIMSVGVRIQEGSQTMRSESGEEFVLPGGSRKSIYAGSEGDVREGALIGQLMNRIKAGDPDLLEQFESKLFEKPLGLALKYVGSSPLKPINIETFATGGRAGISKEDTVPALLTPGEFVINKKAAQKIGYNTLHKLNHADKVQGYNKGGAVGLIQKFASGGAAETSALSKFINVMQWVTSESRATTTPQLNKRPDIIGRSTVGINDDIKESIQTLTNELEKLGLSASNTSELLKRGGDISYKSAEKALTKDIERLKIGGAGIEAISEAETKLAEVRKASKEDVGKRRSLDTMFGMRDTSGKKIIGGATTTADLLGGSGAGQQAIEMEAKSLAAARIKSRGGNISAEERSRITERSYVDAAARVTGTKKSDFKAANISGSDIQKYIAQSMSDRKTLAEMDKQLIKIKQDEVKNAAGFSSLSRAEQNKQLAEAKKAAQEEISIRREIVNDLAAEKGQKGVGAAGFLDFRNSPILKMVKNITASQALTGVGLAAGAVAGQGQNIAKVMYRNDQSDNGQINIARTGAAIEKAGITLAAGLTASAEMLTIPVVGPWLAGLTALGVAAYTAVDYFTDFTGAQKAAALEMEKSLRTKQVETAMDDVSRAFDALQKDVSNLDLQAAFDRAIAKSANAGVNYSYADTRQQENNKAQSRSWLEFFAGAPVPTMTGEETDAMSRAQADKMSENKDKTLAKIDMMINSGKIKNMSDFTPDQIRDYSLAYGTGDEATIKEVNKQVNARGGASKVSQDEYKAIFAQVAAQKFLTSTEIQAAIKSKQLADALEAADRAGRKMAQSFERLFNSINDSIGRIDYESDMRRKAADAQIAGLNGQAQAQEMSLKEINVLDNRKAYQPKEFNAALDSATSMLPAEQGKRLKDAAQLEANLGDNVNSSIAAALKDRRSLTLDEASNKAKTSAFAEIDNMGLAPELAQQIKGQIEANMDSTKEKIQKSNLDPQAALDKFAEEVSNSGRLIGDMGKQAIETAKKLLTLKQNLVNNFIKGINQAAKAAKEASDLFKKAKDIRRQGTMNVREVTTGVGETFEEMKARRDQEIAGLTGGLTDPTAIRQNIQKMSAQAPAEQAALDKVISNPASTDKEREAAASKFMKFNESLNNSKEALDKLADSTELAEKALNDLKNVRELQKNRESFVNTLLTNTPEEADKLNQTFIRLQRNLSGGLNGANNQRDARKAFNETLRQTGSVREATKAGNTVLANQRKETLSLMQDPGMRAGLELQMRNSGMNDVQVADRFKAMETQLMKQMAMESGQMNNPLVKQAIAAKENPNADPAYKQAANRYLEAQGLQAKATEEQAQLKLAESSLALKSSNDNLRISLDDLRATIEAATNRDSAIEGGQSTVGMDGEVKVNVAAGKAIGGLIYASEGQFVNFQPQGTDTVPAMLTPGEFVINAKSTAEHLPLLKAINSGNYSKGGVVYLADGGQPDPTLEMRKEETKSAQQDENFTSPTIKQTPSIPLIKADVVPWGKGTKTVIRPNADQIADKKTQRQEDNRRMQLWRKGKNRSEEENSEYTSLKEAKLNREPDPNDNKYKTRDPLKGLSALNADRKAWEKRQAIKEADQNAEVARVSKESDSIKTFIPNFDSPISNVILPVKNNSTVLKQEQQTAEANRKIIDENKAAAEQTLSDIETKNQASIDRTLAINANTTAKSPYDIEISRTTDYDTGMSKVRTLGDELYSQAMAQTIAQRPDIKNGSQEFAQLVYQNQAKLFEKAKIDAIASKDKMVAGLMDKYKDGTKPVSENDQKLMDKIHASNQSAMKKMEEQKAQAPSKEMPNKDLWVNSDNPAIALAGYVGGVTQGAGDIAYGAANVVAGGATALASPLIGAAVAASTNTTTVKATGALSPQAELTIRQIIVDDLLQENPNLSQSALTKLADDRLNKAKNTRAAGTSDYYNNSQNTFTEATNAAANIGVRAITAGAMSVPEAAMAVAGMGPIMTGEQTALQRNDARNVAMVKEGMGEGAAFLTEFSQTAGYIASQGAATLANPGSSLTSGIRGAGRAASTAMPTFTGAARGVGRVGKLGETIMAPIAGARQAASELGQGLNAFRGTRVGQTIGGVTRNTTKPFRQLGSGIRGVISDVGEATGIRGGLPEWMTLGKPNTAVRNSSKVSKSTERLKPWEIGSRGILDDAVNDLPGRTGRVDIFEGNNFSHSYNQSEFLDMGTRARNGENFSLRHTRSADDLTTATPNITSSSRSRSIRPNNIVRNQTINESLIKSKARSAVRKIEEGLGQKLSFNERVGIYRDMGVDVSNEAVNRAKQMGVSRSIRGSEQGLGINFRNAEKYAMYEEAGVDLSRSRSLYKRNKARKSMNRMRKGLTEPGQQRMALSDSTQAQIYSDFNLSPSEINEIGRTNRIRRFKSETINSSERIARANTRSGLTQRLMEKQTFLRNGSGSGNPRFAKYDQFNGSSNIITKPNTASVRPPVKAITPNEKTVSDYVKANPGTSTTQVQNNVGSYIPISNSQFRSMTNSDAPIYGADNIFKKGNKYYTLNKEGKYVRLVQQNGNGPWIRMNKGGIVYASNGALAEARSGQDTVPAMLTPGEFVINRDAAQQHMPLLHSINSGHFNMGGAVNYLANGGIVAPKYYANAGPVTSGSGSSGSNSGVSNDISSSISAAVGQAMNEAVGQLSTTLKSGMETYSQMMQSSTEKLNNFGQTFASASQTIASSATTWSETASQIPNTLTAEITGRQEVKVDARSVQSHASAAGEAAGHYSGAITSQNTMAKYDRTQFEGGLNSSQHNQPMRGGGPYHA